MHLHSSNANSSSRTQDQHCLARLQICSLLQGNMRCAKCHWKTCTKVQNNKSL